jgi:hypothetical protein|tara:strand:- start:68 stop:376 length:309 start_codon:yes stop_codon:yes gene_type:complete
MQKAVHSTKIAEKISIDGDNIVIKKTFDASGMLKDAQQAREVTENSFASDYKHVGNVDMGLLGVWLKEAGVSWEDTAGVKSVLKKKLMSNEFRSLRVWDGSF